MDARQFLEDMLSEGKDMLGKAGALADRGAGYAADQLGAGEGSENRELYKTIAKGAAGAGALALALGTKTGGSLARLGTLAALGTMAYGAYQKAQTGGAAAEEAATIDAAEGPDAERRARAILKATIAGARADGGVDAAERALIEEKLAGLGAEAQTFFLDELMRPVDPTALAALAESPQEARELYAAAAIACGQTRTDAEHAFLSALAGALGLGGAVTSELDSRAFAAA